MKILRSYFFCVISVILASCEKEEPYVYQCHDGTVQFELFNDELNPGVRLVNTGNTALQAQVIQDEHELYTKLEIAYLKKKVNFKNRSLIVVSIKTNTLAYVMSENVTANCSSNKLTINAIMRYGSQPVGGISYVFAIVPKIPEGMAINFIPEYIY
jgi:membrane-bound inhibitor of C-type lysozyme